MRDGNAYGHASSDSHVYANSYSNGNIHAYTYGGGYGYAYRNAKLHTELHIHNGDRSDRAGNHGPWQPLR